MTGAIVLAVPVRTPGTPGWSRVVGLERGIFDFVPPENRGQLSQLSEIKAGFHSS